MNIAEHVKKRARLMEPGAFAMVMATGIVSVDATQHGMRPIGLVLFWLNCVAYAWLIAISVLRFLLYRDEMIANFREPGHGAGFLTFAAGTCVLAVQCMLIIHAPEAARALAIVGAIGGGSMLYIFLFSAMTRHPKATFSDTINGTWLVVVVATQSLAVITAILAGGGAIAVREDLLFVAMCLYLIGCAWYLIIITLITYRMVLLPLDAHDFTPPYWINMGALAISTLAGSMVILHAPTTGPLHDLLPFVKGFTLFYWASATWWIPLLLILAVWRHIFSGIPVNYEVDDWDIVFPVGMYTVCTQAFADAVGLDYLYVIPDVGVYISLLLWLVVAIGLGYRLIKPYWRATIAE